MEFFTHPDNLVFAVCFALMGIIAISELVSMLLGFGISDFIENALPDVPELVDVDVDVDVDLDADLSQASDGDVPMGEAVGRLLAWLKIGKVPFLISLSMLLLLISFWGFTMQSVLHTLGLPLLPRWLAVLPVFFISIPFLRWGNGMLGRVWPHDETTAISDEKFVGQIARITIGQATHERAAEAKLVGPHGRTHYIMVVADREGTVLEAGQDLLVTGKKKHLFTAIVNVNSNLSY